MRLCARLWKSYFLFIIICWLKWFAAMNHCRHYSLQFSITNLFPGYFCIHHNLKDKHRLNSTSKRYCSPTSLPNRDKETEFQAATDCKIGPFDCLNFPPCICILLFYASWQGIRILVLFSWRKNARCSVVLLSIRFPCRTIVQPAPGSKMYLWNKTGK